jgi:hypothetical protein
LLGSIAELSWLGSVEVAGGRLSASRALSVEVITVMRSPARGQHHVPLMLQEAFTTPGAGKKAQVHVFDKREGRTFRTSPENILQARDFNTFEQEGVTYCLEGGMGDVEALAAPVLRQVITERSLAGLSYEQRAALMVFAALQRVRGVSTRASMINLDEQIRARLTAEGQDPDIIPQLRGGGDPEQGKLSALMLVGRNLGEFARSFADKTMLLIAAAPEQTFLLGDTPVTLANQTDTGPYGNLGLQVKGIEIYLPIAPDLTLGFWCPSLFAMLEEGERRTEESLRKTAAVGVLGVGAAAEELRRMRSDLQARKARLTADLAALRAQTPISSDADNMEYYNSLQVIHAERYLLSSTGDFSLPRRMLADNPKFRGGARLELA